MLKEKYLKKLPIILLVFIVGLLFVTNYQRGTWLSGWDNVQAELNPALNVKRAVFSVWQEYQSFGLTSGMAHAVSLVHALLTWGLSLILPLSIIRYLIQFLMVFVGVWGIYVLFNSFEFDRKISFVGSLFYLLNFGTVQLMSLPMEGFTAFFAFLPWEIYFFLKFLNTNNDSDKTRNALLLLGVNFLGMMQFLTQTLFIVYLLVLIIFSLGFLVSKFSLKSFGRVFVGLFLVGVVNSFWLLPQVYFVATTSDVVKESKINQMATDNIVVRSNEQGTFFDYVNLRSMYSDLLSANGERVFGSWITFFSNPVVKVLPYVVFGVVLVGLLRWDNEKYSLSFKLLFLVSLVALMSSVPPFSLADNLLRRNEFINQIFRSPFTKFSVLNSLVLSYLLVSGLSKIATFLREKEFAVSLVGGILVLVLAFPAFRGGYVADIMHVSYPDSYRSLIEYFNGKEDKSSRIALLPDSSFWGWFKYSWGYEGSGFLWYGIEQPIVSRTFDVWSAKSESFYWEFKHALETFDSELVARVLSKYDVDYVVLDHSLIPITPSTGKIRYEDLDTVLSETSQLSLDAKFGDLSVFTVNSAESKKEVSITTNTPKVGPVVKITDLDNAYRDYETYIGGDSPDVYYPFLDFTTHKRLVDANWKIEDEGDYFLLTSDLSGINLEDYELNLPEKDGLKAKIFLGGGVVNINQDVDVRLSGNQVRVVLDKELIYRFDLTKAKFRNCGRADGLAEHEFEGPSALITAKDKGINCFGYELPLLAHWNGYLVSAHSNNYVGNKLLFYILGSREEEYAKQEDLLETGENYFVLKPGYFYNDGYIFSFQNIAYGESVVQNSLDYLHIYLLPFDYIKDIKLVKNEPQKATFNTVGVNKKNYFWYDVSGGNKEGDLILWQAYDPGWIVLCGDSICDAGHVSVNNWANGWSFNDGRVPDNVRIVFWPQILQFFGYFALLGTLFFLVITAKDKNSL